MSCTKKYYKYRRKPRQDPSAGTYMGRGFFYKKKIADFKYLDEQYVGSLDATIKKINSTRMVNLIDDSHGLEHALTVLRNVCEALNVHPKAYKLTERQRLMIKLAALLHDIDDHKYFPNNHDYENARAILNGTQSLHNLTKFEFEAVIYMIDLVSVSKNGDVIPIGYPIWFTYPRYADRLEAIGLIGIERTLKYALNRGQPLFTEKTERARDEEDLFENIATVNRYASYNGKSVSMMDHFYDKLLRVGYFPIRNRFFDRENAKRNEPIIEFALFFAKEYPNGTLDPTKPDAAGEIEEFSEKTRKFISDRRQNKIYLR
jgi:HD superfamily phosphodiesterase